MNYKELLCSKILKHENTEFIDLKKLEYYLWYTSTIQSHIQRTKKYENTLWNNSKYNNFIALLLIQIYDLEDLYIYNNEKKMDEVICSYSEDFRLKKALFLCLSKRSNAVFNNYYEKIRNSLAHGAFNMYKNKYYYLGQNDSNIEGKINFLLQTDNNIFQTIDLIDNIYNECKENLDLFLTECIKAYFSIDEIIINSTRRYYSKKYKKYIIIDSLFSFKTNNHKEEIKVLLEKYKSTEDTVIIIFENKGNFSEKNLISEDGYRIVVFASDILNYFNISNIHYL